MRAWQREHEYMMSQRPKRDPDENNEAVWQAGMGAQETAQDAAIRLVWDSTVPGSYAKERVIVGAVQAMENRGYVVPGSERLIERGLAALQAGDMTELSLVTQELWEACFCAPRDEDSPYWTYTEY